MYWARWNSVPCNQNKQAITRHWGFEMCYFYLGRNCQKIWYQKYFLGHSQNPKVFKGLGSNKSLIIIQIIWIYSKVAGVLCFPLCSQARESYLKASTAKMLEPQGSLGSVALSLCYYPLLWKYQLVLGIDWGSCSTEHRMGNRRRLSLPYQFTM